MDRPDWHHTAPCRDRIDIFYPPFGLTGLAYDLAGAVCRRCCHLELCRAEGDSQEHGRHDTFGYRAGESPEERTDRRRTSGTTRRRSTVTA